MGEEWTVDLSTSDVPWILILSKLDWLVSMERKKNESEILLDVKEKNITIKMCHLFLGSS